VHSSCFLDEAPGIAAGTRSNTIHPGLDSLCATIGSNSMCSKSSALVRLGQCLLGLLCLDIRPTRVEAAISLSVLPIFSSHQARGILEVACPFLPSIVSEPIQTDLSQRPSYIFVLPTGARPYQDCAPVMDP